MTEIQDTSENLEEFVPPQKPPDEEKPKRKPAGDRGSGGPARPRTPVRIPNRRGQFIEPVTAAYMAVGGLLMTFDATCANAFIVNARPCAEVWDALAYDNESVRRFLWQCTQVSLITKLLLVHMPIVLAIMLHHSQRAQNFLGSMGEKMAEQVQAFMSNRDVDQE